MAFILHLNSIYNLLFGHEIIGVLCTSSKTSEALDATVPFLCSANIHYMHQIHTLAGSLNHPSLCHFWYCLAFFWGSFFCLSGVFFFPSAQNLLPAVMPNAIHDQGFYYIAHYFIVYWVLIDAGVGSLLVVGLGRQRRVRINRTILRIQMGLEFYRISPHFSTMYFLWLTMLRLYKLLKCSLHISYLNMAGNC